MALLTRAMVLSRSSLMERLTAAGYPVLTPAGGTITIKNPATIVLGEMAPSA